LVGPVDHGVTVEWADGAPAEHEALAPFKPEQLRGQVGPQGRATEAEEYRELDDGCVLVLTHQSGPGKASGLEVGQISNRGAFLFHVRDGNVTRHVVYCDRNRAFADLGITPDAGT
jgi:hypothetical protein